MIRPNPDYVKMAEKYEKSTLPIPGQEPAGYVTVGRHVSISIRTIFGVLTSRAIDWYMYGFNRGMRGVGGLMHTRTHARTQASTHTHTQQSLLARLC